MTSPATAPEEVQATHAGIVCPGELLRADRWEAPFGDPLVDDAYFRVVFLEETNGPDPGAIHDARIAAYVPGARPPELGRAEDDALTDFIRDFLAERTVEGERDD